LGAYLLRPIARVRRQCPSRQLLLTEGFPKPEEDHSRFLFGLQAHQQYRTGVLKIGEADPNPGAGYRMSQEVSFLTGVLASPEVDVVGAEDRAGKLRIAVRVLQGEPPTGQHTDRVPGRL
jgi:hypothetical protein